MLESRSAGRLATRLRSPVGFGCAGRPGSVATLDACARLGVGALDFAGAPARFAPLGRPGNVAAPRALVGLAGPTYTVSASTSENCSAAGGTLRVAALSARGARMVGTGVGAWNGTNASRCGSSACPRSVSEAAASSSWSYDVCSVELGSCCRSNSLDGNAGALSVVAVSGRLCRAPGATRSFTRRSRGGVDADGRPRGAHGSGAPPAGVTAAAADRVATGSRGAAPVGRPSRGISVDPTAGGGAGVGEAAIRGALVIVRTRGGSITRTLAPTTAALAATLAGAAGTPLLTAWLRSPAAATETGTPAEPAASLRVGNGGVSRRAGRGAGVRLIAGATSWRLL